MVIVEENHPCTDSQQKAVSILFQELQLKCLKLGRFKVEGECLYGPSM